MWKSINAIADFKVDSPFDMDKFYDVVFFDKLFGDVAQFAVDILGAVHGCLEVEHFNVKSGKLGAFTRKDAVDQELYEVEGSGICSNDAWISDVFACNSDASAIGIRLLGAKGTNNI